MRPVFDEMMRHFKRDEATERTTSPYTWVRVGVIVLFGSLGFAAACGGDDLSCGEGTKKDGSKCVVDGDDDTDAGAKGGSSGSDDDGGMGGRASGGSSGGKATGGTSSGGTDAGAGGGFEPPAPEEFEFAGATSAAPADEQAIQLTWKPATYPLRPLSVIRYGIYASSKSENQNFSEPIAIAPPGATSFLLEGLEEDEEVFFVVRAMSDDGPAEDDNTVEVSAAPQADKKAPSFDGVTEVKAGTAAAVRVSWKAASDDLTPKAGIVYQVEWSAVQNGAASGELGGVSIPGDTSVVVSGLPAPEAEYYFHVTAIDAAGNRDDNAVERKGKSGVDDTPPIFGGCRSVANVKANGALVTWDAAIDDTTPADQIEYRIYAYDVPVDEDTTFQEPAQVFVGGGDGQVTALLEATFYRVVCRAADIKGNEDDNLVVRTFETLQDGTPPDFDGVVSLTTRSTEADVDWTAATDNQTEQANIEYDVFLSDTSGGYQFDEPPYASSIPGATGMTLFNLPSNTELFIVVRARDEAGNRDENEVEIQTRTLVSFSQDIQTIFSANCALDGCHKRPNPLQGQNLEPGFAYDSIYNVPAVGSAGEIRVNGSSTDRVDSYLYRKIANIGTLVGSQMPPTNSGRVLTEGQKETIGLWIEQGAQNN